MKRLNFICLIITALSFANMADCQTPKYYAADWNSLKNYQVPEWYYDAKFGIWTHWGVYSVPAFRGSHAGEWYPRWMYLKKPANGEYSHYEKQGAATAEHHTKTYGDPSQFGYHDFIPMFKAEKWNPDEWADLAIDCGAKFFSITGMHHDGFAMYDSDYTEWDAKEKGPKRDLVGDLAKAVRKKGLKFGISNHFAHNRNYYQYYFKNGFAEAYKDRPELQELYSKGELDREYMERWWNITTEMVRKYNPDLYYFDWGFNISFFDQDRIQFCSYFYNHAIRAGLGKYGDPNVVLNYKSNAMRKDCAVLDLERAAMSQTQNYVWQTDTSVSDHSWGYSTEDTFKSPQLLIRTLIDIVSKNGIMMLNFGPKADGTIPDECKSALLGMGKWLKVNGEAIYASRPSNIPAEGPTNAGNLEALDLCTAKDIRYTQSKDGKYTYAISFGLPEKDLTLQLSKVKKVSDGAKVTMLSNGMNIPFRVSDKGQLVLDLSKVNSKNAGCEYAYCYKIEGIELGNLVLTSIELAEVYINDMKAVDPLPGTYTSEFPYLSAIQPIYERAHGGIKRDMNYHKDKKILINGKEYNNGLLLCPFGDFGRGIFIIKTDKLPKLKSFSAEIGIEDAANSAGNCEFIIDVFVKNKWQQIFKSNTLTHKDDAVKIDVKIPSKAKYIRFITTDGGNGAASDHAMWANAKFNE